MVRFVPGGPQAGDTPLEDQVSCTCYPSGFSPETYEGPQPWCDKHGRPSVAWAQGFRDGWRQAREMLLSWGTDGH